MIDYARPLIDIERLTRVVSNYCLHEDYVNAELAATELVAEVRILQHTLLVMKEKQAEANGRVQS